MEECPNCFCNVYFITDTCPSCGKSRKDVNTERMEMGACIFDYNDSMPPFCIHCGNPTTNYKKFKSNIVSADEKTYYWIMKILSYAAALFLTLTAPISFLFKTATKKKDQDFVLFYPECESCKPKSKELEILDLNWNTEQIRLVVNKKLKEEYLKRKKHVV